MNSKRIEWIDVAKGITILLVIIGHSFWNGPKGIIYSFHMPLFFILSIVTYKFSKSKEEYIKNIKKSFYHLFLTAIVIYFFQAVIDYIIQLRIKPCNDINQYIYNKIYVFKWSTGHNSYLERMDDIGFTWFLLALFWGRAFFDFLQLNLNKKIVNIFVVWFSIIGVFSEMNFVVPFSLDIVFAIQPFFLVGKWLKENFIKIEDTKTVIISSIIWIVLFIGIWFFKNEYLDIAQRCYPLFPLCYICAIAGTLFISGISNMLLNFKRICDPLKYLGRYSMIMLWIHCFDKYYNWAYELTNNLVINCIIRVIVDCVVFVLVMKIIKLIKKDNKNEIKN